MKKTTKILFKSFIAFCVMVTILNLFNYFILSLTNNKFNPLEWSHFSQNLGLFILVSSLLISAGFIESLFFKS